jgi:hypothetical protein
MYKDTTAQNKYKSVFEQTLEVATDPSRPVYGQLFNVYNGYSVAINGTAATVKVEEKNCFWAPAQLVPKGDQPVPLDFGGKFVVRGGRACTTIYNGASVPIWYKVHYVSTNPNPHGGAEMKIDKVSLSSCWDVYSWNYLGNNGRVIGGREGYLKAHEVASVMERFSLRAVTKATVMNNGQSILAVVSYGSVGAKFKANETVTVTVGMNMSFCGDVTKVA